MKRRFKPGYILFILFFCVSALSAQENKEIFTVELEPYFSEPGNPESEAGKISYKRIVQEDRDTAYFRVKGIETNSRVFMEMSTEDGKQKLQFQLFYPETKEVITEGEINSRSSWKYQFAADEDFVLMAVPEFIPSAYYLLVWVGNEEQLDLSKTYETDTTGLGELDKIPIDEDTNVVWIIVFTGFLVVILVILFIKGRRKKEEEQ